MPTVEDLASYHTYLQLRRFSNNTLLETVLDHIESTNFPTQRFSLDFEKEWTRIMLGICEELDTIESTAEEKLRRSLGAALCKMTMEDS